MVRMRFPSQTKLLSLLLSFIIICNLVRCETKGSCNQKDKQILLCFKHGLTDPSHILSSWSDKEDCCEWRGVLCDINGRVINLSLRCITYGDNKTHCLSGEFHLSIFELEFLNYLDLSNHDFKAIHSPLDCQNMSLVNTLHRSGNFSNVVYLDLSYNENLVVDDLRWLLRLSSSLEYLHLNSLNLHKQTQWFQIITMLPSLSELYMSNCLLENASPSVLRGNFTSLENIDLSYNDFFSEMPIWLFNLSRLSYMDLGNNRFYGQIPETLSNLRNMYGLYLGGNKLNGTIPNGLGQLAGLSNLDLSMNLLTSVIPTTLWNLSSLLSLDLSSNNLTGVVSDRNFAQHSKLRELGLGSPSIVFDFESHWMPPFKLQRLDLQYADVKLLPWLYTQESLTTLKIEYSFFKNVSQDMFWSLANNCAYLYLTNNNMTWDISNVLLNSNNVVLDGNGLSGDLPKLCWN